MKEHEIVRNNGTLGMVGMHFTAATESRLSSVVAHVMARHPAPILVRYRWQSLQSTLNNIERAVPST